MGVVDLLDPPDGLAISDGGGDGKSFMSSIDWSKDWFGVSIGDSSCSGGGGKAVSAVLTAGMILGGGGGAGTGAGGGAVACGCACIGGGTGGGTGALPGPFLRGRGGGGNDAAGCD